MRMWRHVQDDGLALEEVLPGSPTTPPLFLEFDCPGCDEFHSVGCGCSIDHEETFLCECVPPNCPSCNHQLRPGEAIDAEATGPLLVEEPAYK